MSLVDQFKAELARVHVRQQAARFARIAGFAFVSQLSLIGTGHLDRAAVVAAAVGALEAAFRQWAPVVPWAALTERLHLLGTVQAAAVVPPAPLAVVVPPAVTDPGSGV